MHMGKSLLNKVLKLFSPVKSPSTVGTCSNRSFRNSSFLATLRSSRGHASSSEVVFNITKPSEARDGDWINCGGKRLTDISSINNDYRIGVEHSQNITNIFTLHRTSQLGFYSQANPFLQKGRGTSNVDGYLF